MSTIQQPESFQHQLRRMQVAQRAIIVALSVAVVFAITTGATIPGRGIVQDVEIIANDPPIGTIMAFAGHWPKDASGNPVEVYNGWCLCEGTNLSRSDYPDLLETIGELYGKAPDEQSFLLPDLRGMFLRGVDTDKRIDTESHTTRFPQPFDRSEKDVRKRKLANGVGTWQEFATALPTYRKLETDLKGEHQHAEPNGFDRVVQSFRAGNESIGLKDKSGPAVEPGLENSQTIAPDGNHAHSVTTGGDVETRPINVAIHWIIKAKRP